MTTARCACPVCAAAVIQHLKVVSFLAEVDYFQCKECFEIWNVPKGQEEPIQFVTDPKERRRDRKLESA
jgi:hypothetical protein